MKHLIILLVWLWMVPSANAQQDDVHTVRPGDTLFSISREYKVPVDSLRAWNSLDGTGIKAGLQLRIRRQVQQVPPPAGISEIYTVRAGDTLYGVARAHDTDVTTLRRLNDLDDTALRVGQELRVPAQGVRRVSVAVYPPSFDGRILLDGSVYHAERAVVGHPDFPLGSTVLLDGGGEVVTAVVADRPPGGSVDVLDVSPSVARRLGIEPGATIFVRIQP